MRLPTLPSPRRTFIGLVVFLIAVQVIPYGRDHHNPPRVQEPPWDRPQTRELAKAACFDCHSNETIWPWYANLAPVSWLVQHDVEEGRRHLNFSDWRRGERKGEKPKELREVITEGEMPPLQYRLIHAEARLSEAQKRQLLDGLAATVGAGSGTQ